VTRHPRWPLLLVLPIIAGGLSCSQTTRPAAAGDTAPAAQTGTLAYDRGLWIELLREHTKLRRVIRHTEKGVETVTETDDPALRAKLVDHALAMQTRMKSGARVRVWDPVFRELFEARDQVRLEVTPTDLGVQMTESADDPRVVALLRSHAMGVSDFVRHGRGSDATARFNAGDPLPPSEVAIGGVPHRFILSQPTGEQIGAMTSAGVTMVVNFRKPTEAPEINEKQLSESAGASYCNVPYQGVAGLTDEVFAAARQAMKTADEKGDTALLHCRSGNRVGAVWAAYRTLDKGVPLEQALAEARMMTTSREMLARVREYVKTQR